MPNDEKNPVDGTNDKPNEISNISGDCNDGACLSLVASTGMDSFTIPTSGNPHDLEYNMCHTHRGQALIFSHEHFEKLPSRPYTNIDSKNLKRVLKKLGFTVTIYKDLQHKDIKEAINAAAALDHSKSDCILIALLTHGDKDSVQARDTSYKLDSIFYSFTPDKCPSLAAKPKLFLVQACRSIQAPQSIKTDGQSQNNFRIPMFADLLIAFCIAPNPSALCNNIRGSWFIYNLCEELEKNSKKMHILQLLTFVSQRVANCEYSHEKQISFTQSTLTKVLRFGDNSD